MLPLFKCKKIKTLFSHLKNIFYFGQFYQLIKIELYFINFYIGNFRNLMILFIYG